MFKYAGSTLAIWKPKEVQACQVEKTSLPDILKPAVPLLPLLIQRH